MNSENSGDTPNPHATPHAVIFCPFCEYGVLKPSPGGGYLVCWECRRKVYEVHLSAPRMKFLLDSFNDLQNDSYDKDLCRQAGHAWHETLGELEGRGLAWCVERTDPRGEFLPDLSIPANRMKGRRLSVTALHALNEMRQYYDFGNTASFLDNVLDVLQHFRKLTPDQSQLRKQVEAMLPTERSSLSLAILEVQAK